MKTALRVQIFSDLHLEFDPAIPPLAPDAGAVTHMASDLFAWVRDIVGGRTRSYEQTLERAQGAAMQMLHQRCRARGATHVTGLRMDCEGLGPRGALIAVIITATLYRTR